MAPIAPIPRRLVLASLAAAALPRALRAAEGEGRLKLYNTHTDERFDDVYSAAEGYDWAAWKRLDWFLRDHYEDVAIEIDPRVFDLLWALGERYREAGRGRVTINIHSAYRTEATNERLRPEGAARNSLHKLGRAVDVSVQGYGIHFLANHARAIATGGLGLYWRARFVHLDTGPKRLWYRRV